MSVAGYVLAGGRSSRMGRDKALLAVEGVALARRIADAAAEAVESVAIVGDPDTYRTLGTRVIPDLRPGQGPLSGMEAALSDSTHEWNLILACDLVGLTSGFLRGLCEQALKLPEEIDCLVVCDSEGRLHPLTALYRRRCVAGVSGALDQGRLRVLDMVAKLRVVHASAGSEVFQNVNTPAEWEGYLNARVK